MAIDRTPDPLPSRDQILALQLRMLRETAAARQQVPVGSEEWSRLTSEERALADAFMRSLTPRR